MKKVSEMSLDELGVLCFEIAERVNSVRIACDDAPGKQTQLHYAAGELFKAGASLRNAFTRMD